MTHKQFIQWSKKFGSTKEMAAYIGCTQRYIEMLIRGDRGISSTIKLSFLEWKNGTH